MKTSTPKHKPAELTNDELLIALLKNAGGAHISGEEIARTLEMSRSAVWKKIKDLEEVGYEIEAVPHLGYRLTGLPERLVPEEIRFNLKTHALGCRVFVFPSIDSTNRVALDMGRKGAPHGQAILAESQTAGRGRLGRTWNSPTGKGIYLSVILRPSLELSQLSKLTLAAAVATAETLEAFGIQNVQIKWPNDIVVKRHAVQKSPDARREGARRRNFYASSGATKQTDFFQQHAKICGILTEMVAEADRVECVILGIGINVNSTASDLPAHATSLKLEVGKDFDRNKIVADLLNRLEVRLGQVTGQAWKKTRAAWNKRSAVKGKSVKVTTLSEALQGTAQGIDPSGALIVKTKSGLKRVLSGDVVIWRKTFEK